MEGQNGDQLQERVPWIGLSDLLPTRWPQRQERGHATPGGCGRTVLHGQDQPLYQKLCRKVSAPRRNCLDCRGLSKRDQEYFQPSRPREEPVLVIVGT